MNNSAKLAASAGTLAWVTAMFVAYYYTHKPVILTQAPALAGPAIALLGWGSTLVGAHGAGRVLVPGLPELNARERFALRIGFGLALLGLLVLALAAIGVLHPLVAWIVALVGLPIGWAAFWQRLARFNAADACD